MASKLLDKKKATIAALVPALSTSASSSTAAPMLISPREGPSHTRDSVMASATVTLMHDHHHREAKTKDNDEEKKLDARALYDAAVNDLNYAYGRSDERMVDHIESLDHQEAASAKSSLLFGEVLPTGVNKILDAAHLDGANATVLYDLGSGNGKLAMQAFLQFPNLRQVVGVELAFSRGIRGMAAVQRLAARHNTKYTVSCYNDLDGGKRVVPDRNSSSDMMKLRSAVLTETVGRTRSGAFQRTLDLRRQNMFEVTQALDADIIICETCLCSSMYAEFARFISRMKSGARLLTYEPVRSRFAEANIPFPFAEIAPGDRYFTSWAPAGGHAFWLWRRV